MSRRFYLDIPLCVGLVTLDGPEAHHMVHVMRLAVGETVILFNGDGHEYPATIEIVSKKQVQLIVRQQQSPQRELPFPLHIATALPKGDRADFLIEKLTELGVTTLTPLHTERSVVKVDATKVEKLQRAVVEASKQCRRNVLMRVQPPQVWTTWLGQPTGQRWLADPDAPVPLASAGTEPQWVAFGPEGGFTPNEVMLAVSAGWQLGSLGPRILRIETACLAAVVALTTTASAKV